MLAEMGCVLNAIKRPSGLKGLRCYTACDALDASDINFAQFGSRYRILNIRAHPLSRVI